jgi:hypothetical protein
LTIQAGGRWFRINDGPAVSCDRYRLLQRLLLALARGRLDHVGDPVSGPALLEAGWPSERMTPAAARNRLHVALHRLRRLGLDDIVCCVPGGWVLDAEVTLEPEEEGRPSAAWSGQWQAAAI